MVVKSGARDGRRISAWARSAEFKAVARKALAEWNAVAHERPKCGARGKKTGEPCKRIALKNGRCQVHGGRTPKGADWHKPVWPNPDRPDAEKRLNRKLRDHQRAAAKRAARVAKMTPEERERYEAWHRTHRPGPPSERAAARQRRKTAKEMAETLAAPGRSNPEIEILQAEIEKLEAVAAAAPKYHDIFD